MKSKLIRLFFFNDGRDSEYIWPQEISGKSILTVEEKKWAVNYLKSGHVALRWKGYDDCRICKQTLGTKCLTDGTFIWPEKIEHYLEEHDILFPDEFVLHMNKQRWRISPQLKIKELSSNNTDESFWMSWCKRNQDASLQPTFKQYKLPKSTGKGILKYEHISCLFSLVEYMDVIPDEFLIDTKDRLINTVSPDNEEYHSVKYLLDEHEGEMHFWSSTVKTGSKLMIVCSSHHAVATALVFHRGKAYMYCGNKQSMYISDPKTTRYCPDLLKLLYEEKL
jgi:hypothetical protein